MLEQVLTAKIQILTVAKGLNKDKSVKKGNFGKKYKTTSYGRSQYMIFFFPEIYGYIFGKRIIGYF